jgi:hypothetical protein
MKSITKSNSDVVRLSHAVGWPFGVGPAFLEPRAAVARLRVPNSINSKEEKILLPQAKLSGSISLSVVTEA